jgi:hypothetical protein
MTTAKRTQYLCAVILIFTSIAMVGFQVFTINDVASGLLFYVGQAFLLAGSIFGLDYYIEKLSQRR